MRRRDREFMNSLSIDYPHRCMAPVTVRPEEVPPATYGHHVSARLRPGWRVWGFRTAGERDKFLAAYPGARRPT